MWYPTLPDLLLLHERICTMQDRPANVAEMSVVDEAILAPQRTGGDERTPEVISKKGAALLMPLLTGQAFEHCNDRVAYSLLQQFVNRNGFILDAPIRDFKDHLHSAADGDDATDDVAFWIQSRLQSRFDDAHRERIFGALNTLAEVKSELERVAGFHDEVDRIDTVGAVIARHIASLFRLDEDAREEIKDEFPVFADAWRDALDST